MAKIMDPILTILSVLGYWAIILGSFGGSRYVLYFHTRTRVKVDEEPFKASQPVLEIRVL